MRPGLAFLAAFAVTASPAPAAAPAGAVHAEIRRDGRVVWHGDLVFALIPEIQFVGVQLQFPDPRIDASGREDRWSLDFYPADFRAAEIPVEARYRRPRQEYYYSFSWSAPLEVAGSPPDRSRRIESSQTGYFVLGRGERKVIRLPDNLVVTFRR